MENKEQRPLFLGFSSQKGGVGKSTLAEIVSSILYYEQGINLFVMDCDLSQDSFYKLREREKSIVQESEELSKSMQEYFHHLGKKAYRIYKSAPKEAVRTARSKIDGISNEKYQLVIFDFPGHAGTTELMELSLQMDYILSPIEADIQSLVSCLAYAKTITEIGVSMSDSRIKDIILFWNKGGQKSKGTSSSMNIQSSSTNTNSRSCPAMYMPHTVSPTNFPHTGYEAYSVPPISLLQGDYERAQGWMNSSPR